MSNDWWADASRRWWERQWGIALIVLAVFGVPFALFELLMYLAGVPREAADRLFTLLLNGFLGLLGLGAVALGIRHVLREQRATDEFFRRLDQRQAANRNARQPRE